MGLITFDYTNPGAAGDTPARGSLTCRLVAREVAAGAYRTVHDFTVQLVDGKATVSLSDTGPAQCWRVSEAGMAGATVRYVAVSGDAAFTALVDVDPATLQPSAEPIAAWVVALGSLAARVDGIATGTSGHIQLTQAAYDALTPDAGTLYVIIG